MGDPVDRASVADFAREVERMGFHSGWTSDHVCWPERIASAYPYSDDGAFGPPTEMAWLEAIATQLFVAGCTESLRLGFSVLILPYRLPVITAKQLATLDVLSGGRLILGCGVGWMWEEAEILGVPFDHRGARADEQLALFETLFRDERPRFDGNYYQLPTVGFEPKPVQNPLPVWVGGASAAAARRAARFGTGFHAAFEPMEQLIAQWARVRAEAEAIGRDPEELTLSVRLFLDPEARMPAGKSIQGSPQCMHDRVGELIDAGVGHVLVDPVVAAGITGSAEARLDVARAFMAAVGSQYAGTP